jgi:hypothetical protein
MSEPLHGSDRLDDKENPMRNGVVMDVRSITDDDIAYWQSRQERAEKVEMRGEHIGAENIEVLRCWRYHDPDFRECWRVPYVVPDGDGTTYWFTMFSPSFPPVACVMAPPDA